MKSRPSLLQPETTTIAAASVVTGAACLAVATLGHAFAVVYGGHSSWSGAFASAFDARVSTFNWIFSAFLTPLVETLLFLIIWRGTRLLPARVRNSAFLTAMVSIGLVLHGFNIFAVGKAIAFGCLAALFLCVAKHGTVFRAFSATAFAHIVWNVTALVLVLTL